MRPSFVAAVVLPALFSAASAAPATGSTSTKVPVEVDVYFGPIRDTEASEDVQRAQSLSGDVTIMEDPIYCGNTQLGWFDDVSVPAKALESSTVNQLKPFHGTSVEHGCP